MQKVVNKYKLHEQPDDYNYWKSKIYQERIAGLEQTREEYNSWKCNGWVKTSKSLSYC